MRERKLPKWYWCDPGIVRSAKRSGREVGPEERGALFEGLVAQLIRAYRDYRGLCEDCRYWSPASGSQVEVDFLLSRGKEVIAVEAKSGGAFAEHWCKGLRAVAELPGLVRRIVVYPRGPALRTADGIDAMSFEAFAAALAEGSLWP